MSKKTIALSAVAGLAVGFVVAWKLQQKKLDELYQAHQELVYKYAHLACEAAIEFHKNDPDWEFSDEEKELLIKGGFNV
jgi:hypothetical protein